MLLSHKTSIKISQEYSNIIGHMCYAASKLWNICNYERRHYKELGLEKYPDWYYQKKAHKGNLWYKQLPSQTAQETCKQLDKAWRSFYVLKKTGGIKEPNPPRFKQDNIPVTYMQMGIRHEKGSDQSASCLSGYTISSAPFRRRNFACTSRVARETIFLASNFFNRDVVSSEL